jgi:hypothetical protein
MKVENVVCWLAASALKSHALKYNKFLRAQRSTFRLSFPLVYLSIYGQSLIVLNITFSSKDSPLGSFPFQNFLSFPGLFIFPYDFTISSSTPKTIQFAFY